MTVWTRSAHLPSPLRRWINLVCVALDQWSRPFRWFHEACLELSRVQRRRHVRLGLEGLEARELLDANSDVLGTHALVSDLTRLRNDAATSAITLVNAVQSSPTNTPTLASVQSQLYQAWTTLTTDWNQTWQAAAQWEGAALGAVGQELGTLLNGLGIHQPGPSDSPAFPTENRCDPPPTSAAVIKPQKPRSPPPLPTVSLFEGSNMNVNEGTGRVAMVVAQLSAASTQTVTVQFATSDGTATAGKDYLQNSGTLTFMPGSTQATANVTTLDDNAFNEPSSETFLVTLFNPSNAILANPSSGVYNILEDPNEGSSTLPPVLKPDPCSNDG